MLYQSEIISETADPQRPHPCVAKTVLLHGWRLGHCQLDVDPNSGVPEENAELCAVLVVARQAEGLSHVAG